MLVTVSEVLVMHAPYHSQYKSNRVVQASRVHPLELTSGENTGLESLTPYRIKRKLVQVLSCQTCSCDPVALPFPKCPIALHMSLQH